MAKVNVIQAVWLEDQFSWCEYCANKDSKKTYLPFHKNVANPEHICEDCVKNGVNETEFNIVNWFENRKDYYLALTKEQESEQKQKK